MKTIFFSLFFIFSAAQAKTYSCQYEFPPLFYSADIFLAQANSEKDATTGSYLLCIKTACDNIGAQIENSTNELMLIGNDDLLEILTAQGYSDEEKKLIIAKVKNLNRPSASRLNCETGSPLLRQVVLASCSNIPMICR